MTVRSKGVFHHIDPGLKAVNCESLSRLRWFRCMGIAWRWLLHHEPVINPEQNCGEDAHSSNHPPHHCGLVFHFAVVVNEKPAKLPTDKRSDAQRQKRESHVGPLLSRRGKSGNVFVVTW